jgi:hypothetical protein
VWEDLISVEIGPICHLNFFKIVDKKDVEKATLKNALQLIIFPTLNFINVKAFY